MYIHTYSCIVEAGIILCRIMHILPRALLTLLLIQTGSDNKNKTAPDMLISHIKIKIAI